MATALAAPVTVDQLEEMFDRESDPKDLREVLRQTNIPVYDPQGVTTYKLGMVEQVERPGRRLNAQLVGFVRAMIAAGGLVILVYCLIALTSSLRPVEPCVIVLGALTALMVIDVIFMDYVYIKTAEWRRISLKSYTSPVPLAATALIEQIREYLPDATFGIDELTLGKKVVDPLLYVAHDGRSYCIAVWGEPRFDAKLMH